MTARISIEAEICLLPLIGSLGLRIKQNLVKRLRDVDQHRVRRDNLSRWLDSIMYDTFTLGRTMGIIFVA